MDKCCRKIKLIPTAGDGGTNDTPAAVPDATSPPPEVDAKAVDQQLQLLANLET